MFSDTFPTLLIDNHMGWQARERRAERKAEKERQEAEEAKRACKAERRAKAAKAAEKAARKAELEIDPAAQVTADGIRVSLCTSGSGSQTSSVFSDCIRVCTTYRVPGKLRICSDTLQWRPRHVFADVYNHDDCRLLWQHAMSMVHNAEDVGGVQLGIFWMLNNVSLLFQPPEQTNLTDTIQELMCRRPHLWSIITSLAQLCQSF